MTQRLPDPPRWRKTRDKGTLDGHLGALFERAQVDPKLSLAAEARILSKLKGGEPKPRAGRMWVPGLAVGVALLFASYAVATGHIPGFGEHKPAVSEHRVIGTKTLQPALAPTSAPVPTPAPTEQPLSAVPEQQPVSPPRGQLPRTERKTKPRSIASEAALLGDAFRVLRIKGDATAALDMLDVYAAAYPAGALAHEALTARTSVLVMLNRRQEALALLGPLTLLAENERKLLTTRAELRALENQCASAIADFDHILMHEINDAFAERALQGRAHCYAELGNAEAARADLKLYLKMFPSGRFAERMRRALSDQL